MDRRALIAVFISTLLIIGYELFLMPKPPVVEPGPREARDAGARAREEVVDGSGRRRLTPPGPEIGEPPPVEPEAVVEKEAGVKALTEAVERIIDVSTPLFTMEIDTRGGLIRSTRLHRYDDPAGGPVVLNDSDSPGGLGLLISTGDGEIDARSVVFTADKASIRIDDPTGVERLTLRQALDNGIVITRVFTFRGDTYEVGVNQKIGREEASPEVFSYRLLWEPGVAFTEGDPLYERGQTGAITSVGGAIVRDRTRKVKGDGVQRTGDVKWTAVQGKYFAVALIPVNEPDADVRIRRIGTEDRVWLDVKFPVRSSAGTERDFFLYAGPLEMAALSSTGVGLEKMIDLGYKPIQPLSKLMLKAVTMLHKVVRNYGVVIVLVSVLTKLLFYRLTHKSFQSMKDMQKIQGQVNALKEKYKNDSQRMNKEMWALYKREGVNPMGGCLPMLLQMPVFIALYSVLRSTIELRQAPFVLWINDLSRPDVLFHLPFPLPFLGENFCLLPILMGVSMFLQQKMTTVDPRQKAMVYMMPIVFTVMFYRLPSGLVLYWFVNNVLSIGQQWMIHRGGNDDARGTTVKTIKTGRDAASRRDDKAGNKRGALAAKETR